MAKDLKVIGRFATSSPICEKQGRTIWVACKRCSKWFHISEVLQILDNHDLHCPYCHLEFKLSE